MHESATRRRSRFWLYAPLILVLLLAAGWTGFWFYAAHRTETTIAAWIEREAASGRIHACGHRTVGGYPFRIEMRCDDVTSEIRGLGQPAKLRTASLLAVTQIWEPTLLIAELSGPMTVAFGEPTVAYTVEWRVMRASLRGFPRAFERVSLSVDEPIAKEAGTIGSPVARAKHLELHARLQPGSGSEPLFDVAGQLDAAVLRLANLPSKLAETPIDATLETVVHGVSDLSPKPMVQRLKDWQANGGRLEVKSVRVAQGDAVAVTAGDLGLTPQGFVNGNLRVRLAGLDHIASLIFGPDAQATTVLRGVTMLAGRSELEGKRAVTLPLRFKDGGAFLGPIPLGRTPPLY